MQIIEFPERDSWAVLLSRPKAGTRFLERTVANILDDVRRGGDEALRHCSRQFDPVPIETFEVSRAEIEKARGVVPEELKRAIGVARSNIKKFHFIDVRDPDPIETSPDVVCWKRTLPIEKVGLYIPGGTAPLFSTVLMLAIPAKLAGCGEVVMCTPPNETGSVSPATLFAADLCGVDRVFKIGGAQAIGAMAFGTETVPAVHKIFGPGNQFVTEAKLQILRTGIAIDMPAGPSELAVIADETCVPEFVAADLLSQAEHGPDSQVLLVTDSRVVIERTLAEVDRQIERLPRRETARRAMENSTAVLMESVDAAIALLDEYAPEHLIVVVNDAAKVAMRFTNAGSVFIGNFSCESAGDYASGTNHTLPTGGAARAFSGVSTESFRKTITYQMISPKGMQGLAPVIEAMADAEGLEAHRYAAAIRRSSVEQK